MTAAASDAGRLTTALLTMDVVDEIRHRERELRQLAESGLDDAGLKRKLADIYRSQGIEVPDAVLEAGIAAQRERRYVYEAPTGHKAWLARQWINRAVACQWLGKHAARSAVAVVILWTAFFLFYQRPMESRQQSVVTQHNAAVAGSGARVRSSEQALREAKVQLDQALVQAAGVESPGRLAPLVLTSTTDSRAAHARAEAALAEAKAARLPTLERIDGRTRLVGGDLVDEPASKAAGTALAGFDSSITTAELAIAEIQALGKRLGEAVNASELLDTANVAALALRLPADAEALRARSFAAGEAALRGGDIPKARQAASQIDGIGPGVARLAALAGRLQQLRTEALATGVSGKDRETFEAAIARVESLARIETVHEADEAEKDLEAMVGVLAAEYTYRIVNSPGMKSGVWRYNEASPDGRNHYLVVEALDAGGKAVTLPIRNEEDGQTYEVAVFAVRVPEAEYERVGADKTDNGIIEADVIGTKPRGRLAPEFTIPTGGGYITAW